MQRVTVPEAEALLGVELPCLNKGHVMLIDYMGGDYSVVQAARTSYGKDQQPWNPEKDKGLINYLMAHRHTTPFEMVQIKLRMKLPIFVARQWVRHRTASLNEVSARYTQLADDFYVPELEDIQAQSKDNKQGRDEDGSFTREAKVGFASDFEREQVAAYEGYEGRIEAGMAKELARLNLPVSIYTEWYWNQNLWNMLHLLGLRRDKHAQKEIRVYAEALWQVVKAVAPVSAAAWENHFYEGARFSRDEMEILQGMVATSVVRSVSEPPKPTDFDLSKTLEAKLGKRGAMEFLAKLRNR